MLMCIHNLVKFCPFILKIWSKTQILASVKGHNSVAKLQKKTHYKSNVDLVNDNVHTKLSNCSQDIERKPNYADVTE